MKYTILFSFFAIVGTLAAYIEYDRPFNVLAIRSNAVFHLSPLRIAWDESIEISPFPNNTLLTGSLGRDGRISLGDGKYLAVKNSFLTSSYYGSTFNIGESQHLSYNNITTFSAVKKGSVYKIAAFSNSSLINSEYNIPVVLRAFYTAIYPNGTTNGTSPTPPTNGTNGTTPKPTPDIPQGGSSRLTICWSAIAIGVMSALLL